MLMNIIVDQSSLVDISVVEMVNIWRKRLIFRAWHRGTREMDILVGRFAETHVPTFNDGQLQQFERMLTCNDPDVYDWYIGAKTVPPEDDTPVLRLFLNFKLEPVE